MNRRIVVHFGAGALGRGLVVPLLRESGCEVVLADTDEALNRALNESRGYVLTFSDEAPENRRKTVGILEALSPLGDREKLAQYLRESSVVTTSVRRENLPHVARFLAKTWGSGSADAGPKIVICCENIEHAGRHFKELLMREAKTAAQKARLAAVRVPDTVVDRICAADWPAGTDVVSEKFYECAVDAGVVDGTGIRLIPSVRHIGMHFARKRCLMNAYADAIAFIAIGEGKTYLHEAAASAEINRTVAPYLSLVMTALELEYGFDRSELIEWRETYRKRLCNAGIPRRLDTVARNLWPKLAPGERFVRPLIRLLERGVEIGEGAAFLAVLIRAGAGPRGGSADGGHIKEKLRELWCESPGGLKLYEQVAALLP